MLRQIFFASTICLIVIIPAYNALALPPDSSAISDSLSNRTLVQTDGLFRESFDVTLKNHKRIRGKVIRISPDSLVVTTNGGRKIEAYKWTEVESIKKGTTSLKSSIAYGVVLAGIGIVAFWIAAMSS